MKRKEGAATSTLPSFPVQKKFAFSSELTESAMQFLSANEISENIYFLRNTADRLTFCNEPWQHPVLLFFLVCCYKIWLLLNGCV